MFALLLLVQLAHRAATFLVLFARHKQIVLLSFFHNLIVAQVLLVLLLASHLHRFVSLRLQLLVRASQQVGGVHSLDRFFVDV